MPCARRGVRGNPDVAPILQDDWKLLKSNVSKGGYSPAGLPSTYKSVFKSAKKEGMSAEEKADRIYSFEYVSCRVFRGFLIKWLIICVNWAWN